MTINFDFSGAEIFLSHLRGQIEIGRVLEHPAYQTVARHAQMFGNGILKPAFCRTNEHTLSQERIPEAKFQVVVVLQKQFKE